MSLKQRDIQKNEIKVEKSKVSLICQFSFELIRIPVRGEFCQHKQCFSLNSYLELMFAMEHKKWVCPICKKVCFNFIIDKYQQWILDRVRQLEINVESVTLNQDGRVDKEDPLCQIISEGKIRDYNDVIKWGFTQFQRKSREIDEDDNGSSIVLGRNEGQTIIIE
ncbi:unnamed protein product [Paramecium octaurelia]|uniref:SP-RING-type domain-containing protein n=1 Tax=Paramecium octaurelia TaxID=43137 RepID=A0A8S1U4B4_PAROT|nr:unnamed protein product [Paramecium octaurelia]